MNKEDFLFMAYLKI